MFSIQQMVDLTPGQPSLPMSPYAPRTSPFPPPPPLPPVRTLNTRPQATHSLSSRCLHGHDMSTSRRYRWKTRTHPIDVRRMVAQHGPHLYPDMSRALHRRSCEHDRPCIRTPLTAHLGYHDNFKLNYYISELKSFMSPTPLTVPSSPYNSYRPRLTTMQKSRSVLL